MIKIVINKFVIRAKEVSTEVRSSNPLLNDVLSDACVNDVRVRHDVREVRLKVRSCKTLETQKYG